MNRMSHRLPLKLAGLLIVLAIGGLEGCTAPTAPAPTVYVAGFYGTPQTACYWKDGIKTDLDTGADYPAYATSVFVSGGSVYIAGYHGSSSTVACYWVDGVRHDFASTAAVANSIFVSGGTAYTAGYYNNGSKLVAVYWIGTSQQPDRATSGSLSVAQSIFVESGNVYIAGLDDPNACYWTNNTETPFTAGTAYSIYVSGGTAYVAGQDATVSPSAAVYWVASGSPTTLPGSGGASANGIVLSGGTVYAAGQYAASTTPVACYWADGSKTDLPGVHGVANSIYISGGTIYTAGTYGTAPPVACYWTRTAKTDLPGSNGNATSIFVQ